MPETVIIDNGTVWTHRDSDVYTVTNDNGDTIRALRSDLVDDDTED